MTKLTFTTTGFWDSADGFGCASLGLAGICDNSVRQAVSYPVELEGTVLTGSYDDILAQVSNMRSEIYAAIIVFGNAGGENAFMRKLQQSISCPMVGGGAAIDAVTGRSGLIPGNGEAAVFLITDDRYTYQAETRCIHSHILETCTLTLTDARTIQQINGIDAVDYLTAKKLALGLSAADFEHLTLSDCNNVNAHLSLDNGMIKSGRDLAETMLLRYVEHSEVYEAIRDFYDDTDAIIFGCAGLAGLLDRPLNTKSLGLFLFGEVCTVDCVAEFGNLMLSKLKIIKK